MTNNDIFMGEFLVISTMDHTQLQPVNGKAFLLSSHNITCFETDPIKTLVRATHDFNF